jgi:hypothetical protein
LTGCVSPPPALALSVLFLQMLLIVIPVVAALVAIVCATLCRSADGPPERT